MVDVNYFQDQDSQFKNANFIDTVLDKEDFYPSLNELIEERDSYGFSTNDMESSRARDAVNNLRKKEYKSQDLNYLKNIQSEFARSVINLAPYIRAFNPFFLKRYNILRDMMDKTISEFMNTYRIKIVKKADLDLLIDDENLEFSDTRLVNVSDVNELKNAKILSSDLDDERNTLKFFDFLKKDFSEVHDYWLVVADAIYIEDFRSYSFSDFNNDFILDIMNALNNSYIGYSTTSKTFVLARDCNITDIINDLNATMAEVASGSDFNNFGGVAEPSLTDSLLVLDGNNILQKGDAKSIQVKGSGKIKITYNGVDKNIVKVIRDHTIGDGEPADEEENTYTTYTLTSNKSLRIENVDTDIVIERLEGSMQFNNENAFITWRNLHLEKMKSILPRKYIEKFDSTSFTMDVCKDIINTITRFIFDSLTTFPIKYYELNIDDPIQVARKVNLESNMNIIIKPLTQVKMELLAGETFNGNNNVIDFEKKTK